MRIVIATVQNPFITGGAEIHAQMLKNELTKRGHEAEIVTIPFKWYPGRTIVNCMMTGRMMDLSEVNGMKVDRVIAIKFPAYYVKHENKVIWLEHQHRQAYELWGTRYGDIDQWKDGEKIRKLIWECDKKYISEAKKIFTIAQNTSNRLLKNNGVASEVLYHPPLNYEKMFCDQYGEFVFYASRIDTIKRQRLLVEAARYLKTDAKVIIAGGGSTNEADYLKQLISRYKLSDKVKLTGFITEEEKLSYYSKCLAVYFGAYDEDYGYITLEGFFSKKPVIVHEDAGGPLEFVENDVNGFVIKPNPATIAEKIDELFLDRKKAQKFGEKGYRSLKEKHIDWDYVINRLLE